MGEQFYRLVKMWNGDEWPFTFDADDIDRLNEAAPPSYTYMLSAADGQRHVELFKYVGEYEEGDLDG